MKRLGPRGTHLNNEAQMKHTPHSSFYGFYMRSALKGMHFNIMSLLQDISRTGHSS